jgi:N-formylglutamate deformylase
MPSDHPTTDHPALFNAHQGDIPLLVCAPHVGTLIAPDIAPHMNATGLKSGETDFNVHRLFDFAPDFGASTQFAIYSRYVIDLNRDPAGQSLYPGQFETNLCPITDFDGNRLYEDGLEPNEAEISRRRASYFEPYHAAIKQKLAAIRDHYGFALLIDAHSVRPAIPNLFKGRLPDINIGTHDRRACAPVLIEAIEAWMTDHKPFSTILDGRFKGGYTTRHHGDPKNHIHAVQFEIVQDTYLDMAAPHLFDPERAAPMAKAVKSLTETLLNTLKTAY